MPSGFRLPTVKELASLVDLAVAYPGPTIDQTAFPDTPGEDFWTSSIYVHDPEFAWYIGFAAGGSDVYDMGYEKRVRCVR